MIDDDKDPCDWPSGDCVFAAAFRAQNAKLARYEEREPLVQALLRCSSDWNKPETERAMEAVRDFKLSPSAEAADESS